MELSMAKFCPKAARGLNPLALMPGGCHGIIHGGFCPKAARGLNPLALAPEGSANLPEGCHGFNLWRILPEGREGIKSARVDALRLP